VPDERACGDLAKHAVSHDDGTERDHATRGPAEQQDAERREEAGEAGSADLVSRCKNRGGRDRRYHQGAGDEIAADRGRREGGAQPSRGYRHAHPGGRAGNAVSGCDLEPRNGDERGSVGWCSERNANARA